MSWEGYYEYLCETGHYFGRDGYDSELEKCPRCAAAPEWRHQVDQTNGYDENDPGACPAPKAIKGTTDVWHEDHHGNKYAELITLFEPAPGSTWRRINDRRKPRHNIFAKAFGGRA